MKERYCITGMTCSACSSHVEKAVSRLEGIEKASVNLLAENMEVSYDEGRLSSGDIIAAVEKAGYGAELLSKAAPGSGQAPGKRKGRPAAEGQGGSGSHASSSGDFRGISDSAYVCGNVSHV